MKNRPNILFLMSDEHRADVTGYEGNKVIRTPVLDDLAHTAVVFRHAYTPSPACMPARQCMSAGQLPGTCNCIDFGEDLPPGHMTFPRRLSQFGYETVCAGKLHHTGPDQMQGWTQRIGIQDIHVESRYIDSRDEAEHRRIREVIGRQKWSNAKEIRRAGVGLSPYAAIDDYTVDGALLHIDRWFADPMYDRPQSVRPLLLKVSLLQPHYPFFCDEDKFTYYLNRVELFADEHLPDNPILAQRRVEPGRDVSWREIRRATAAYYGMVQRVDELFGLVLRRLEHVGQDLDDWIIIYTSDHGDMLGEHGIWEKSVMYEGSVRVPLIIRWPRCFGGGRVVEENVNLCDLFATLCELADVPVPKGLDSRCLVPLLHGKSAGWDNESVSQYTPHQFMIKQDDLKYIHFRDGLDDVLFDLAADPGETSNCIADPAYTDAVKRFRARMAELGHGPAADPQYKNAGYSGGAQQGAEGAR